MERNQFSEIVVELAVQFPSVAKTLDAALLRSWFDSEFSRIEPEAARDGLKSVRRESIIPNGERFLSLWLGHSRVCSADIARRRETDKAKYYADGEGAYYTHTCQICRDSGYVPVWDRGTMAALLKGDEPEDVRWRTADAACSCRKGETIHARHKGEIARLGVKDYHIPSRDPDSKAKAIQVAEAYRSGMQRAEPAFKTWNES